MKKGLEFGKLSTKYKILWIIWFIAIFSFGVYGRINYDKIHSWIIIMILIILLFLLMKFSSKN